MPVHHDIAWPLWVAGRVLAGAQLYVDVVEVHPPLIVGVAMLAVLLGRLPVLDAVAGYHLLAFAAVAVSLALGWRVLAHVSAATRGALLAVVGFVLLPLVGYSFGQEEHLMLALALPYLLLLGTVAGGGAVPRRLRLGVGVLGGVGICMKPFFGPLWVALVLYLAWRRGARRLLAAEVVAPALVICTYIAFTALVTPGYFAVARLAAQVYYDFFPVPLSWLVFSGGTAALLGALLVERALPASAAGLREVRRVLALALVGFYLAVLAQQKGWSYHWYPVYGGSLLLAAAAVLDARGDVLLRRSSASRALRAAAIVLLLGASWARASWSRNFWGDLAGEPFHLPQLRGVVERFAGEGPIAALSVGMPVAFPLVTYTGVQWTPRFACLWMLPGIYDDVVPRPGAFPYERSGAAAELDRYVVEAMTADLVRARPTLLIVDAAPPLPRLQGFDYLAYFGRHPAFRALLAEYAPIGTVGRYQLYRRVQP